jgi:hypothetical protein
MTYVASSEVHQVVRAEIKRFTDDVLAEAIGTALGQLMRENEQRGAALESQIAGLRSAMQEFRFVGQWMEHKSYRTGNFVSMGGQLYHANADTSSRPGSDATWTLAAKSGRDGRDGRDGKDTAEPTAPPEPRRTMTSCRS